MELSENIAVIEAALSIEPNNGGSELSVSAQSAVTAEDIVSTYRFYGSSPGAI